ncbi:MULTISPECIES: DsbE family thiol:disulfide interchange protein [unclassified Caballeronia]|uniref:DsbE family thiol:disulfide interchange protein n=1 Tax=unclassified Caballeronia TaxID=2646786 RepID=UPI002865C126|nr:MULTISPECIES: DsbE family thiol:disulfide interchange protein [unclassified Caballeronia]MDR5750288.1 DsbE family thiol:disulfide interchange protein [Caballeronia sp. LZ024]MDR5844959.1 DsbE family thiol:disulfide interchange protein [Caballeronia sp. LZ031]
MKRFLVPLAVFVVLGALLAAGLSHDPRRLPSALIGRPAPAFDLPQLQAAGQRISPADLRGQVWLLNVWASWCESCRDEHALLVEIARRKLAPIYGLNYKDEPQAALDWIARAGNPYVASIVDRLGQVGIEYGVYGVPETFVIDKAGVIRYRHAGPLSAKALEADVLPLVRRLQREPGDD